MRLFVLTFTRVAPQSGRECGRKKLLMSTKMKGLVLVSALATRVLDGDSAAVVNLHVQRWQQLYEERPLNSFSLPLIQPLTTDLQGQLCPPPPIRSIRRLSHVLAFKPPLISHLFCFNLSLAIAPGGGVMLEGGVGVALWPWWRRRRGYKSPTHTYNCQQRSGCPRAPVTTVTLDWWTHTKVHVCRDRTCANRRDLATGGRRTRAHAVRR